MVVSFAVRHFCREFLYGKMAAWVIRKTKGLFSFHGPLDVLELRDRNKSVLKKECGFEICGEVYSNV